MINLRLIHQCQNDRRQVRLEDGRVGKVVRVDTSFPGNRTEVSVYTKSPEGPGIARVDLQRIVGIEEAS